MHTHYIVKSTSTHKHIAENIDRKTHRHKSGEKEESEHKKKDKRSSTLQEQKEEEEEK